MLPEITSESVVLNLFDVEGIDSHLLTKAGLRHTNCLGEGHLLQEMNSGRVWDVVLAMNGMQRFYATTAEKQLEEFIYWLRNCSKLTLIVPNHESQDASNPALGPYRLHPGFTAFKYFSELPTETGRPQDDPVVALSDHVLFDGLRWHESENLVSLTQGASDLSSMIDSARRPRTFVHDEGYVIKSQVGTPDYFDSLEALREAEVLAMLAPSISAKLNMPQVLNVNRGRSVSTTVRQGIPGNVVMVNSVIPDRMSREKLMRAVINLASSYAELGLFHNDFRPWNILETPSGLQMIDFADVSMVDQDVRDIPQILALVGTLTAVGNLDTNGYALGMGESFDTDLLEMMRGYLNEHSINIGALYGRPWLDLPTICLGIDLTEIATPFDLCDQLFAQSKDRIRQ